MGKIRKMPKDNHIIAFLGKMPISSDSFQRVLADSRKPYREHFAKAEGSLLVSFDYDSPDLQEGCIAYHPVFGPVYYRSSWRFSTERFIQDLQAAEANPAIIAHIIHVDSIGGEAFGCHEAFKTVKALKKPCYGVIDTVAASAGYYLVAAADKIYARSIFSEVGCIGTMGVLYDDSEMLKQIGLEKHEYYSSYSPLKNKVFNDAKEGNGDEFVKKWLDPMALQFIEDIKSVRPGITIEAQEGESYYTADAMAAGLLDGENTLEEVVELIQKKHGPKPAAQETIDINQLNFSL